jgi:hypothetical protein
LTVVWQDDKGGLQTYCRVCDKWTDVVAGATVSTSSSSSAPTTNNNDNEGLEKDRAEFFVHVGDFLSLATIAEGNRSNHPMWPSPRHRVVCPPLRQNACGADSDSCRRSLVYFAYPPPGISLDAVRTVLVPLVSQFRSLLNLPPDDDHSEPINVYDNYSLLHNQSHQPRQSEDVACHDVVSSTKQTYHRIKGLPFDDVIFEKWHQVQRKANL